MYSHFFPHSDSATTSWKCVLLCPGWPLTLVLLILSENTEKQEDALEILKADLWIFILK